MRNSYRLFSKASKRGFGLIGIVISFSALAIMALGLFQVILNSKKGQLGVRNSLDFDVTRSSINTVLKDPDLCAAGLKNLGNTASAIFKTTVMSDNERLGSIYIGTTPVAIVNQKIGSGLELKKLDIVFTGTADTTSDAPNIIYNGARLSMEATRTKGSAGVPVLTAESIIFSFKTNSMGVIVGCGSNVDVASSLHNLLKGSRLVETTSCLDNTLNNNTLVAACNVNERLLTCDGGPGDIDDVNEGYWITPNYTTNTCTLNIASPDCDNAGHTWRLQRVTAVCFTP